jgi:hypothetical protein
VSAATIPQPLEGFRSQRRPGSRSRLIVSAVAGLVVVLVGAGVAGAQGSSAASKAQQLVLYAGVTRTAYVNNADDRSRGEGRNPFGNYSGSSIIPPTNERIYGPFAGDEGEIELGLFSDAAHKHSVGTAIEVCQYNFDLDQLCDVALRLGNGEVVAKGGFNFNATKFTLSVVGGTNAYRSVSGSVGVFTLGVKTQPKPVLRVVPMLQSQRIVVGLTAPLKSKKTVAAYSTPYQETFINNDDDEARGAANDAFANHKTADAAHARESSGGPFPGDEAFFSFKLFANPKLRATNGSALYSCQYEFNKNAFCDASFQLNGGTLIGAGALVFNGSTFELSITGGTGIYSGMTGEVSAAPYGSRAQHLTFTLS